MARAALIACSLALSVALLPLGTAHAQREDARDVPGQDLPLPEGIKRSYLQASFNKIRPGSLLRGEGAKEAEVVEHRSALEIRRDTELLNHYGRIAELDVMLELATRTRNMTVAERIELVRRREVRRFLLAMQSLQVVILGQLQDFGP